MRRFRRIANLAASTVVAFSALLTVGFTGIAHAATYTCTWNPNGLLADHVSFNDPNNWTGCNSSAPQPGDSDDLVFDTSSLGADATLDNNITGLTANSITFSGSGSHDFTIDGNALTLAGDITVSSAQFPTISAPLTISGGVNFSTVASSSLDLTGVISGNSAVVKAGAGWLVLEAANTYTGNFTANAGSVFTNTATAFGVAGNTVTINDGADLSLNDSTNATFANDFTFTGLSSVPSGSNAVAKLSLGGGSGGGVDELYGGLTTNQEFTLSGTVTLGSDVTFGAFAKTTTITGPLSGAHKFTLPGNWGGKLVINSSNNTSSMDNGTYTPDVVTQTLSDDQSAHTVYIGGNAVITIDGKRGDTTVASGGELLGTGTVGALTVNSGATVAPGHSPGCLNTGDLTEGGNYNVEIGGADVCTGYDQLKVTGTVDLTNGTLNVSRYNDFKDFTKGQTFTIIDNDGADAVTGTFNGLAEGATFTLDDGTVLAVSYVGGDGNDVVLTVQDVPSTPDTGFSLVGAHPLVTLSVAVLAAGTIAGVAQKTRKISARR